MNRRQALAVGLAGTTGLLLGAHTPYQQWVVYRKKHLLIGCHKTDPRTYDLAKQTIIVLESHLPAAKARVARAPSAGRLASLIGTGQMDVAVMDAAIAAGMSEGTGEFAPYGRTAIRLLTQYDDRLLIARTDFPDRYAWLLTATLTGSKLTAASNIASTQWIPWHPGSARFLNGLPEPNDD